MVMLSSNGTEFTEFYIFIAIFILVEQFATVAVKITVISGNEKAFTKDLNLLRQTEHIVMVIFQLNLFY